MTTLTAGDIARYIQRPDEPPGAAIARFRNWEKTGIINASGDQNPGTGRKKQYSPDTVLRAVLLQTLIDTFGSSAVSLSELIRELSKIIGEAGWLRESELLVLSRPRGAPRFNIRRVKAGQIKSHLSNSSVDIHVVIDIKRLFEDRIAHDWSARFRREGKRAALATALKQIEAQFGVDSVMKLSKAKPKS